MFLNSDVMQEIIKYSDNKSRNELKLVCHDFYNAHENLIEDCVNHFLSLNVEIASSKNLIDTFGDFDKENSNHKFENVGGIRNYYFINSNSKIVTLQFIQQEEKLNEISDYNFKRYIMTTIWEKLITFLNSSSNAFKVLIKFLSSISIDVR